jgi:sugar porter (SP) family MFS transporter
MDLELGRGSRRYPCKQFVPPLALCIGLISVYSYTAEITPPHIRGRVAATLNSGIAVGILVTYWVQYGAIHIASNAAWRLSFGLQLLPGIIAALLVVFRPESPRWLVQHGRSDEALSVLASLHSKGDTNDAFVRTEHAEIRASVELESTGEAPSYLALLTKPTYRRRTALAMGLQCMQQLSGANIVLYYAAKVFAQTGRSGPTAALLANAISSALLLVGTVSLTLLIDFYGRRKPIFIGHFTMGLCLMIVASILLSYGSPHFDSITQSVQFSFSNKSAGNSAVAFMFLFQFSFGAFSSSLPWTYHSEVFQLLARARGTSLAVAANYFTNFWLGLYIPEALNAAGWKLYYIFGAINWTCAVIGWLFFPETAGRALEELDLLFTSERSVWVCFDKEAKSKKNLIGEGIQSDPEALRMELLHRLGRDDPNKVIDLADDVKSPHASDCVERV